MKKHLHDKTLTGESNKIISINHESCISELDDKPLAKPKVIKIAKKILKEHKYAFEVLAND